MPKLSPKNFYRLTSVIFVAVGILHFSRVFTGANLVYANFEVPIWLSAVAGIFLFWLSYLTFRFKK